MNSVHFVSTMTCNTLSSLNISVHHSLPTITSQGQSILNSCANDSHWQGGPHFQKLHEQKNVFPHALHYEAVRIYPAPSTPVYVPMSSSSRCCSRNALPSSRNISLNPPLYPFWETVFLPAVVLGPVDCSHGRHCLIRSACLCLLSKVQPFIGCRLQ